MFPLAHGGSLKDIWSKYATNHNVQGDSERIAGWFSVRWFLNQCWGLAGALATTHRLSGGRLSNSQPNPNGQLHADIKPENILCFTRGGGTEGPFTLKLADFGQTRLVVGKNLDTERLAHTKTYRAPEFDVEDFIQLNYDVWSLGCLFLEFITWVLLGWTGVEEFCTDRLEETNERDTDPYDNWREDIFFKKVCKTRTLLSLVPVSFSYKIERKIHRRLSTKHHVVSIRRGGRRIHCKVKDTVLSV